MRVYIVDDDPLVRTTLDIRLSSVWAERDRDQAMRRLQRRRHWQRSRSSACG